VAARGGPPFAVSQHAPSYPTAIQYVARPHSRLATRRRPTSPVQVSIGSTSTAAIPPATGSSTGAPATSRATRTGAVAATTTAIGRHGSPRVHSDAAIAPLAATVVRYGRYAAASDVCAYHSSTTIDPAVVGNTMSSSVACAPRRISIHSPYSTSSGADHPSPPSAVASVPTRNTTTADAVVRRAWSAVAITSATPRPIPRIQSPSASSPSRSVRSSAIHAAYGMNRLSLPRTLTASTEV